VLQHASAALDEVRRQEFFRAGAVMLEHGRGKGWLLLQDPTSRAQLPARMDSRRAMANDRRRWNAWKTSSSSISRASPYGDHPVRFGVVESLNTTIKAVLHLFADGPYAWDTRLGG